MKPDDPPQRLAHDGNISNGPPSHDSADAPSAAFPHAPVSADDVPASVRTAVAEFVPPPGFEDFPTPTKNNLQRSLIYFFGRRVQATATGKSQWFCLASPQCRANKTTISTTANISGCTRHLQVFHQLISPKTAQMSRKASSSHQGIRPLQQQPLMQHEPTVYTSAELALGAVAAESQPIETHEQLQSDTVDLSMASEPPVQIAHGAEVLPQTPRLSGRERALEWTLVVVVKNLLPVSLASDERLVRLTMPPSQPTSVSSSLTEKTVRHHLAELYDAAQSNLAARIRKELPLIALPIFHLALVDVNASSSSGSSSATSVCHHASGPDSKETFVALQVSFVSSAFTQERHVLNVRRFTEPKKASSPASSASSSSSESVNQQYVNTMLVWIDRVLKRFSIEKKHVYSFGVDRTLSTSTTLFATAASTFLGRPCELTCVSTCSAALCDAYSSSSDSGVQKLVVALHEFVALSCDADYVGCFRGVESHVEDFVSATLALKNLEEGVLSSLNFPWRAVALILERVVRSWEACQVFFLARDGEAGENGSSSSSSLGVAMPQLLREFTREDVAQCVSILRPLGDFFGDLEAPESVCAEVIIRIFAIKQTILNAAHPLQVSVIQNGGDAHPQVGGEMDDPVNEQVVAIEHVQLSEFARGLREELSRHWDASIAEKTTSSLPALTSVFFHPCFRHLSFLDLQDGDAKTLIHDQIKKLARDVLQWKAKLLAGSSSSGAFGNSEDDDGDDQGDSSTPLKKRRLSRQEKLNRQAEELSRLGFLDAFATTSSSLMTAPHPGNGGDQQHHDSSAAAANADWSTANLMVNRELERYLKNESVAFCDVPFDKMLTYWQHKAFDYPTLALVAQAALGHPAVLKQQQHNVGSSCIRCCFGGRDKLPWPAQIRDETQAFEELTLFLRANEQLITETSPPAELSEEKATQVVATLTTERKRQQQQQQTPTANVPVDQSVIV